MTEWIAYELLPRICNMSIAAGIVIVYVLAARLLLRRAPKVFSYALWSVVLFRLLCPVSLTASFSLLGLVNTPARETTAFTTTVEYVRPEKMQPGLLEVHVPQEPADGAAQDMPPVPVQQTPGAESAAIQGPVIAARIWGAGVLAMAGYGVWAYLRVRRSLIGAVPLGGNIYLADHIPSPFVMGILRPKIYLPSALREQEIPYILRHEQYHIRRGDHVFKALAFGTLCLHWFNPLVWAAFIFSGKDMEMSCDEAVVKEMGEKIRADYSASLLSLATGRRILSGTPLAFGEGDTRRRIQNLVRWKRPKTWAVLLAAVICIAVVAACTANPGGPVEPTPAAGNGTYVSMEDFVQRSMDGTKTVRYYANDGSEATANVTATKLAWLDRQAEVEGLAPEGTLEAWSFCYLVQVDADDVMLVGGMYEEDGWYDLEGQGGHNVVSLRYPDGSYDILYDQPVNDNMEFYGYHDSYEEAVYDWYVKEKGLELPLYVEDWTQKLGTEADGLGGFPVHRYEGNGWYLYIPIQAWNRVSEDSDIWQSGYNTGSALTVYPREKSAQACADDQIEQGWIAVEDAVPHVRHWAQNTEDYYYDAPDGGCYQVRIEWQAEHLAGNSYTGMEPDVLRAMAASFTVDASLAHTPSPGEAPLHEALSCVQEGDALTLSLLQKEEVGSYTEVWEVSNAVYYMQGMQRLGWNAAEEPDTLAGKDTVTLSGDGWNLTAYDGLDEAYFTSSAGTWWLSPQEKGYSVYQTLRGWFDETEYAVLGGDYDHQNLVIPDEGQTYLEAAAAYVQEFEGIHLRATQGSKYCYSYVKTSVGEADETTAAMRERGEIGENAYCFYLTTVFLPQNEAAREWSIAGNTGSYTGSDPKVPDGAMEYYRCGIITREEDGWHGKLVGTGW